MAPLLALGMLRQVSGRHPAKGFVAAAAGYVRWVATGRDGFAMAVCHRSSGSQPYIRVSSHGNAARLLGAAIPEPECPALDAVSRDPEREATATCVPYLDPARRWRANRPNKGVR